MIFAKTANKSTVFYHCLKFWTLNFNASKLLQKTFAPHGFLFNNVYLHVYYYPSTFVGLVAKHPVLKIKKYNVPRMFGYTPMAKRSGLCNTVFEATKLKNSCNET